MVNNLISFINELNSSTDTDHIIIESIDKIIDGEEVLANVLIESTEYIDTIKEYIPLIEAAQDINSIKKDIDNTNEKLSTEKDIKNKENLLVKLSKQIKKAIDWWYKVDPNKKHATAHTILKMLVNILIWVTIEIIVNKKLKNVKFVKDFAEKLPFGYEGKNKNLKNLFSRVSIVSSFIGTALSSIISLIFKADDYIEYKINEKDLDLNIEKLDKAIDKINDELEDCYDDIKRHALLENKKNMETALSQLIKMKEKFGKNKSNNK